jgi:polyisoprenoid-binding protein YceI
MLRLLTLGAVMAAVAAPSYAAAPPTWTVVGNASTLGFTASMNGQTFKGAFKRWTAQISFDPKNLATSRVVAVIEPASAATGDQSRDEALPTDDWFAARRFPQAKFESTAITAAGPNRYVAQGILTLRGAARPVSLPFTLSISGDTAQMIGAATIDRSQFGVGQGQWKTGEAVALKVQVNVSITAKRIP